MAQGCDQHLLQSWFAGISFTCMLCVCVTGLKTTDHSNLYSFIDLMAAALEIRCIPAD